MMSFLHSQFKSLPYPTGSYDGKTIVVTGSNIGLGKEAARHFARLGAKRLILAVRSIDKGEEAKKDIEDSVASSDTRNSKLDVQVWKLDMGSYKSVQEFAAKVDRDLDRVDIFLANAGIATGTFSLLEDNEASMTVNVVSTFLLTALVLPKLKESAAKYGIRPTLTITASDAHRDAASFVPQAAQAGEVFALVNNEEFVAKNAAQQYPTSKLLEIFAVRALTEQCSADKFPVTINCVSPGLCHSGLSRNLQSIAFELFKMVIARSTEVGSRNLVSAASMGVETHGKYLADCELRDPQPFVTGPEGVKVQNILWRELLEKLEAVKPGVMKNFS